MKKRLKIILIVLAVIALLVVLLLAGLKKVFINMLTSPMAPDDYTCLSQYLWTNYLILRMF